MGRTLIRVGHQTRPRHQTRTRAGLWCPLAVGILLLPQATLAQNADARQLFEEGTAALQEGRFAEAKARLREAHALAGRPATAFNLAIALTGTGEVVEALTLFDALLEGDLGPLSEEVEAQIAQRRAVAERAVAHLSLRVTPADASIRVDGESVETERRDLAINPGTRIIDVSAEGFQAEQRRLEIEPGARQRLVFSLEEQPEGGSSIFESPWFWTVVGVLVVGGAVTAGILIATEPERPDVDETVFTLQIPSR